MDTILIKRFRNWSILPKIMTIAVASVILLAATVLFYILPLFERKIMEEKKAGTRHVVEVAYRVLEEFGERSRSGNMSLADAQGAAKLQIKGMRYNGQEYFWINDLGPRMIMHPTRPELDGSDLTNHKDPKGVHLFAEFVRTATKSGEGFVGYLWPKPGSSEPVSKISFVKLYKPWGWIIGSGIYVDDVFEEIRHLRNTVLAITFFLSVVLLLISFSVGLGIIRPLKRVIANLDDIAAGEGDLTRRLEIERNDESGALAHSLNQMNAKLVDIVQQVHGSSSELGRISSDIISVSKQGVASAQHQSDNVSAAVAAVAEIDSSLKEIGRNVTGLSHSATDTAGSIHAMTSSIDFSAQRVEQLKLFVDEVTGAISQIAISTREIGENVSTLYDASVTTASSIAQMDSTSREVQEKAVLSAETTSRVLADARTGKQSVEATIDGIRQINDAARVTSEVIGSLSSRVENIGSILTVISEVTERTHLLSLNASIIAAQAGSHGKSFAVVASEVKDLAEKTRASTQKIEMVIRNVQTEAQQALGAMRRAEKCIHEGTLLSQQSGSALTKIVDGALFSRQQTEGIALAMNEQAEGSRTIKQAMEQVSSLVSASASSIRQQEVSVELISAAASIMLSLAGEVLEASRSQNRASKQISEATQNVMNSIAHIKGACDEQNTGSSYIINSIENIRYSAEGNLASMLILDDSIERLTVQIRKLEEQVGRFKT